MSGETSVALLVSSGNGPGECRQAVRHTIDAMMSAGEERGLDVDVTERPAPDGPSSAVILLSGAGADAFASGWEGPLLWRCKSALRPRHKRKNWFVEVFRLKPPDVTMTLTASEVTIQAIRAGGPGGQHQNTTSSAIRARWSAPSGQVYSVVVRSNRSQHQNRRVALERLGQLVATDSAEAAASRKGETWQLHSVLQRGSPKRVFDGPDFREVT
ncbi:MAG: peptide chain release factor-like protein [Pseudomonadota bacterium]